MECFDGFHFPNLVFVTHRPDVQLADCTCMDVDAGHLIAVTQPRTQPPRYGTCRSTIVSCDPQILAVVCKRCQLLTVKVLLVPPRRLLVVLHSGSGRYTTDNATVCVQAPCTSRAGFQTSIYADLLGLISWIAGTVADTFVNRCPGRDHLASQSCRSCHADEPIDLFLHTPQQPNQEAHTKPVCCED